MDTCPQFVENGCLWFPVVAEPQNRLYNACFNSQIFFAQRREAIVFEATSTQL